MESVRRAVIDIGTNSVKLLVADVRGRDVQPVQEESRQTRLGRGFYETHRLQPDALAHTAEVVWEFSNTAREKNAVSTRVIATSAARDAVNPGDLIDTIRRVAGLKVEIISGETEAEWAFRGVTTGEKLAKSPLLLLDVGGGSTEFILGRLGHNRIGHSFPLGTVRLMEKFPLSDPPTSAEFTECRRWIRNFLKTEVRPKLESTLRSERRAGQIQLVGTGGTTSILARIKNKLEHFDRDRIEGVRLSLEQVQSQRWRLWKLPLTRRKEIPGLPKQRADVILTGVAIYEEVMKEFRFRQLRVSTRGLRFGAVMD